MTAIAEQDVKHMMTHIEALEALVQQQKDFMAESATTWRNLLEKEQTLSERGWRERDQLDERFQLLNAQQAAHADEVSNLQMQIAQSRDQLRIAEKMLEDRANIAPDERSDTNQIDILKTENEDIRAQLSNENLRADKAEKEAGQSRRDNAEAQDRLADMSDQLSKLSNVLRQRQEEIEQAWAELVIHRQRVADLEDAVDAAAERETALEQNLKDANSWVFKLSGERAEQERRLGTLTRERNDAVEKLATAQSQVSSLRQRLDLLLTPSTPMSSLSVSRTQPQYPSSSSVSPANARHDGRAASGLAHAGRMPAATSPVSPPSMAVDALLQPVIQRDKKLLLDRLTMPSGDVVSAPAPQDSKPVMPMATAELPKISPEKASVQEPVPAAMRMTVPSRNPQLERQLKAAEAQVAWLRSLTLASLAKPNKWTFMPLSWHLSRMSGRFKRKGLFDEQSYLSRYPDVADSGMDPLVHYLKHGIDEGRER